jgi:hypothetical protein
MKKVISLGILCLLAGIFTATAQVSISADGSPPDSSAMLDMQSADQGFLFPRLTISQVEAIENPAEGLLVYCTERRSPVLWNGTQWVRTGGKPFYKVGEKKEGGIVFYVYPSGLTALIVDTLNFAASGGWGAFPAYNLTDTAIGSGESNTAHAAYYSQNLSAIKWCDSHIRNGYSDWFLPSRDELIEATSTLKYIVVWVNSTGFWYPIFNHSYYWSSSMPIQQNATAVSRDGSSIVNYSTFDGQSGFRCVRSTDNFNCLVLKPDAGPDQLWIPGTSTILQANSDPASSGLWSIISGVGGSFADPTSSTTLFTGLEQHFYELQWTFSKDCGSTLWDQVKILFACPESNAGPDQLNLAGTSTVLQGNAPPSTFNGLWTIMEARLLHLQTQ